MGGGILSAKIVAAVVGVVALVGVVVPMVHALDGVPNDEGHKTYTVNPGADTLKDALANEDLEDGDTLKLMPGSYTGKTTEPVKITKAVKIIGAGGFSSNSTTITVPLTVELDDASNEKAVVLQGFASSNQTVSPDRDFIKVTKPVNLKISDVRDWGVHFGDFDPNNQAKSLYITDGADGAKVSIEKTWFRNGTRYGIRVEASNTEIEVNGVLNDTYGTAVYGQTAISLDGGNNNTITMNNVDVSGRSIYHGIDDAIEIVGQNDSTLTFNDCKIAGVSSNKLTNPAIFRFSDDSKNTGVTINLNGTTSIREDSGKGTIFKFGASNTHADNNKIVIEPGVEIEMPGEAQKYNTNENYAVVGVYDQNNKGVVQVYDADSRIEDLNETVEDGYRHKGWYQEATYETEIEDALSKTAVAKENFDAYHKAVKLVNLTIKDVPQEAGDKEDQNYVFEQGQTIAESSNSEKMQQDLEAIVVGIGEEKQELKNFVFQQGNEVRYFENVETLLASDWQINEDAMIEAEQEIVVKINDYGEEFTLESGDSLSKLAEDPKYAQAKFLNDEMNRDETVRDEYFWHYVDKDGGIYDENTPIMHNLELTTEYYYDVSLSAEGVTYKVGQDLALETSEEVMQALSKLQNCQFGVRATGSCNPERFSHFVDASDKKATVTEKTTVDGDLTIDAVFDVKVQIGEKEFMLDTGITINEDEGQKNDIKAALDALKNAPGQDLKGFVIAPLVETPGAEEKAFNVPQDGADADALIAKIMDEYQFGYDVVIYPELAVTITIKGESSDTSFQIETGKSLKDVAASEGSKYTNAKFQNEPQERFHRFVVVNDDDSEGDGWAEDAPIHSKLTLRPKYWRTVTLKPREGEIVVGKVEQGTAYRDFILDDDGTASATLYEMESNQGHDTEEELDTTHLHFEGLKIINDADQQEVLDHNKIENDVTVTGIYHYDLDIVQKYDDRSAVDSYTIYADESVNSTADADKRAKIENSLDNLAESANSVDEHRKFYRYYDEREHAEQMIDKMTKTEVMSQAHNDHLYLVALVAYEVQVGGTTGYVPAGGTLREALAEDMNTPVDLVAALEGLKDNAKTNKIWTAYEIKEGDKATKVSDDMVINQYTVIDAKYDVKITIDGSEQVFTIPEGGKLNDLGEPEKTQAQTALENLAEAGELSLDEFSTGDKSVAEVMEREFAENTVIKASHKRQLIIDGEELDVHDTDSLKSLGSKLDKYKNKCAETDGMLFSRFVTAETTDTFNEETEFSQVEGGNIKLTTVCGYEVTVDGAETPFVAEKDTPLQDVAGLGAAVEKLRQQGEDMGKNFARYVDSDNNPVELDKSTNKKISGIKAVFNVTVTINGVDEGEVMECIVDEGQRLSTGECSTGLGGIDTLDDFLDRLEKKDDKTFKEYELSQKGKIALMSYDGGPGRKENGDALKDETFNKGADVSAKYTVNVQVKNDGKLSDSTVLDYGASYHDNKQLVDAKVGYDTATYAGLHHLVDEKTGESVDDSTTFTEHTTLIPKFKVRLELDGVDGSQELEEGSKVSDFQELLGKLNNPDKDFAETFAEEGYDMGTTVNKNVKLTPQYTINVTINGNSAQLKEGQALSDHPVYADYKARDGFKMFRDADGNEVKENEALHKHTTVTAIYNIYVTVPEEFTEPGQNKLPLESGQKLRDLDADLLAEMQEPEEGTGRTFSRFDDEDGNEVKMDAPLYESLTIEPKYNNTITIVPYADGEIVEGVEPLELELGEDWPLSKLTATENANLTRWLKEVSAKLAAAGKADYNPTQYLNAENGSVIDLDKTPFSENAEVQAIFTYSPTPVVPSVPSTTTPTETGNAGPKAPNTGTETTGEQDEGHKMALLVTVSCLLLGSGTLMLARKIRR